MRRLVLAVSLLAAFAVPAAAPAAQADTAARLADLRLATAVRLALATDVRTRALDVEVRASRGTVALDGVTGTAREMAAEVARGVRGVSAIEGDAPVRPAPSAVSEPQVGVSQPVRAEPAAPTWSEPPVTVAPRTEAPGAAPVYHTVARGETLFSLARRYETTVAAVLRLNGLDDAVIRVGQRLRMR